MKKFITIDEAKEELLRPLKYLNIEKILMKDALYRINSEDITANISMPNFKKSPFDGYVLMASSTKGASKYNPIAISVEGTIAAGNYPSIILSQGAYKIMTGSIVPDIFNAVIKKEDTDQGEFNVNVFKEVKNGENIIKIGEDVGRGERLLRKGTVITPGIIAMLSSLGIYEISVYKKPDIALITTGDEVIEVGEQLEVGQIYNSNRYALESFLRQLKVNFTYYGICKDSIKRLKALFIEALAKNDVLITTGGVSIGDYDYIVKVYEELGVEILFWGVQMKPGTPVLAGRIKDKIIISLPGSPAASLIAFEILASPMIRKLKGQNKYNKIKHYGKMEDNFKRVRDMTRILRVKVRDSLEGYKIYLSGKQNACILHSMIDYNALAMIEKSDTLLKKGDMVEFYFNSEVDI